MDIKNILGNFFNNRRNSSTLGDIPLEVISEKSLDSSISVPTKRVENGFNISDTLRKNPLILNITVVDNSRDYLLNRDALYELQKKGKVVDFYFSGRDLYENIVVENITEIESKEQYQGFTYNISLRQIQIASIDENDIQLDSKKAETTGGKKKVTTATTSTPTSKEVKAVEKVRGKSSLKQAISSFGGEKW